MNYKLEIIEQGSATTTDKTLYFAPGLTYDQVVDRLQMYCRYIKAEAQDLASQVNLETKRTVWWIEYFSGYPNGLRINLTLREDRP